MKALIVVVFTMLSAILFIPGAYAGAHVPPLMCQSDTTTTTATEAAEETEEEPDCD